MALQDPSGLAGATPGVAPPAGVDARSTVASGAIGLAVLGTRHRAFRPGLGMWFPKQIVDDSWRITSSVAAVGPRGRYRDTSLWWVLWIAYNVAGNASENWAFLDGIMGNDVPVNQGVVPAMEIVIAVLGVLAFATWVPVVRGLSRAQTELARPYGSVGLG